MNPRDVQLEDWMNKATKILRNVFPGRRFNRRAFLLGATSLLGVTATPWLFPSRSESAPMNPADPTRGYAAAIGWVLFFIIAIVSIVQLKMLGIFREE